MTVNFWIGIGGFISGLIGAITGVVALYVSYQATSPRVIVLDIRPAAFESWQIESSILAEGLRSFSSGFGKCTTEIQVFNDGGSAESIVGFETVVIFGDEDYEVRMQSNGSSQVWSEELSWGPVIGFTSYFVPREAAGVAHVNWDDRLFHPFDISEHSSLVLFNETVIVGPRGLSDIILFLENEMGVESEPLRLFFSLTLASGKVITTPVVTCVAPAGVG